MHRRKSDIHRNRRLALIVGGSLAVIVACLTVIFTAGGSNGGTQIQDVQPASAKSVADKIGCSGFKDYGKTMVTGMGIRMIYPDEGTCHKDGTQYSIVTFSSREIRDEWLPYAAAVGVTPKWETDTAVAYQTLQNGVN